MKKVLAQCAAHCSIVLLYCALPLLPLFAAMLFVRWRFIRHYATTLRKMRVHLQAMREGPVQHFFGDVLGRETSIPAEIRGSCVQCGNCCMNRRCVFLEQVSKDKYQCGIYHSVWRRFSNCGSYPLNQRDIDRYDCPSYYVAAPAIEQPIVQISTEWVPVRVVRRNATRV